MELPDRVRRTAEQHGMFASGQLVVVAVSGGPDSTALLHALHALRGAWPISLVAAHLDHGFRGAESAADAEYVRVLCQRLDIPCQIAFENVPEQKRRLHLSSQEAARRARHAFLRRVAHEVGAARIALGHTRDDRVETILLNIFRGTGPDGLEGFPPVRPPLVRPLYDTTRAEAHEYCVINALSPRSDASDESLDYRRNRLRNELLPYMAEHFNPRISEALLRLSDLVSAENKLWEHRAHESLAAIQVEQGPNRLVLNTSRLNATPMALRRRVLRLAISRSRGGLNGIENDAIDRVLAASAGGQPFAFDLPRGESGPFQIHGSPDTICVAPPEPLRVSPSWSVSLPVEGRALLPDGSAVECRVCRTLGEARALCLRLRTAAGLPSSGEEALLLRLSDLRLPLAARSWRRGDRMRPRGLNGSKKLQDIFVDRKVPSRRRSLTPVIVEAETPSDSGDSASLETDVRLGRILGLLGIQGSESSFPVASVHGEDEIIGPCLLIMALSDTSVT